MSWEKLDLRLAYETDPDWQNVEDLPEEGLTGRIYHKGTEDNSWPRLSLQAGYADLDETQFIIYCEVKEKPGFWWRKCAIPAELAGDLAEVISELLDK